MVLPSTLTGQREDALEAERMLADIASRPADAASRWIPSAMRLALQTTVITGIGPVRPGQVYSQAHGPDAETRFTKGLSVSYSLMGQGTNLSILCFIA